MDQRHLAFLIQERVARYGDKVALRGKEDGRWYEVSWRSLGEQVHAVAKGLIELGVKETDRVGICSANRPEWTIADLAILRARATSVPIYPTSTAKQAEYVAGDANIEVIFVGRQDQYDKARAVSAAGRKLTMVLFDPAVRREAGDGALPFQELLEMGRKAARDAEVEQRLARASRDDLLTLVYTSGTTGEPKGVMLDHASVLSALEAHDPRLLDPNEGDVSLCFLPLSHIFERCWTYYVLYRGMTNAYLEDPSKVIEALQEVKPTIMCAVPRFYEKIYATVFGRLRAAPPPRRKLFHWAIGVGAREGLYRKDGRRVPPALALQHAVADALVLKKIRDIVGGRIKFFPCAGAPLSREIEEFFWAAGIFICHGYGLTETCATVSCHEPRGFEFGTVGRPLQGVQVRIGEDDEILVKGPAVMRGYWGKPAATAEVLADGWFRTGDAGRLDGEGLLSITDRIKDLIKTSGGKYVAPQAIEATLGSDLLIEQVAVIGDQRRFVSALIVPAFPALEAWARAKGLACSSREELIRHPDVLRLVQERIDAQNVGLARHEQIKKFTLLARELTVEGGEITPTMKIKRRRMAEKYRDAIEAMYAER
jgi:long-chain acyl-CoA synthetase